jgi:nicotinate-nucleotide pyrophosphorylase (carboxylating)
MDCMSTRELASIITAALAEDVGRGDVTTNSLVPKSATARAVMVAREPLVVAGIELALETFRRLCPRLRLKQMPPDGTRLRKGGQLLTLVGEARGLLSGERVALNFVQRLSGVATLTAAYVAAVRGTSAQILDTRKTTPGWRRLEKYAVACGGGGNHRIGLYDLVLIKDNHLVALRNARPNAIAAAVARARRRHPELRVEVEADTLDQVQQAVDARADIILLDNMSPRQMKAAVRLVAGRAKLEASGGINLQTVRAAAESGVDFISVGALTHSARAVDIALDFVPN